MLPCAVQYLPCLSPAHVLAFGPVNAATFPCASITANWRPCFVQLLGPRIGILLPHLLHDLGGLHALLQQRDRLRPVADTSTIACVATAPTPASAHSTPLPTENTRDCTAPPTSPVAGS